MASPQDDLLRLLALGRSEDIPRGASDLPLITSPPSARPPTALENIASGSRGVPGPTSATSPPLAEQVTPRPNIFETGSKSKAFRDKMDKERFNVIKGINNIDNLSITAQNIMDILNSSPSSTTFLGGVTEKFADIASGLAATVGLATGEAPRLDISSEQNSRARKIAKGSAEFKSAIFELGFIIAATHEQTGRGLSDRDFEIALDIVGSGGDPDIVSNTLGKLMRRTVKKTRRKVINFNFNLDDNLTGVLDRTDAEADSFIARSPQGFGTEKKPINLIIDANGNLVRSN